MTVTEERTKYTKSSKRERTKTRMKRTSTRETEKEL